MKLKTLKYLLITIYSILGLIAIIDMPENMRVLDFLLSGENLMSIERYWIKIIFDLGKILILTAIVYNYWRRFNIKARQLYLACIVAFAFLYFDLPIHKCYNGNLESYWETGRHFH